jgi:hypothetical protein
VARSRRKIPVPQPMSATRRGLLDVGLGGRVIEGCR